MTEVFCPTAARRIVVNLRRKIAPKAPLAIGDRIRYWFRDGVNTRLAEGHLLVIVPGLFVVSEFGTDEYYEIAQRDFASLI